MLWLSHPMLACHRTSPDPLLGGRLSYEETGAGGGRQPGMKKRSGLLKNRLIIQEQAPRRLDTAHSDVGDFD